MGRDVLYHTAYLRERLLAEVRLTSQKMQCKLHVAFGLNLPCYGSME